MSRLFFLVVFALVSAGFTAQRESIIRQWAFEATCQKPSTTLDGTINVVFDSGSFVVGGVHLGKTILPFHGRHFGNRFLARTDPKHFPVIRIDATLDSLRTSFSGTMLVSKIHAKESRKKAKDYYDVSYVVYAVPK